jgi:hypothetical protein
MRNLSGNIEDRRGKWTRNARSYLRSRTHKMTRFHFWALPSFHKGIQKTKQDCGWKDVCLWPSEEWWWNIKVLKTNEREEILEAWESKPLGGFRRRGWIKREETK